MGRICPTRPRAKFHTKERQTLCNLLEFVSSKFHKVQCINMNEYVCQSSMGPVGEEPCGKTLYSVFILAAKGLYENAILGRNLISKETDSCRIGAGSVSPPAQPGSPDARKPIGPTADGCG